MKKGLKKMSRKIFVFITSFFFSFSSFAMDYQNCKEIDGFLECEVEIIEKRDLLDWSLKDDYTDLGVGVTVAGVISLGLIGWYVGNNFIHRKLDGRFSLMPRAKNTRGGEEFGFNIYYRF